MTKKEITTLLITLAGGWLFVLGLIGSVGLVLQVVTQISTGFPGGWVPAVLMLGGAASPAFFYGLLAYLLIRHNAFFSGRLLRYGRIDGSELVHGGEGKDLAPLLFSLLGLYFVVTTLPGFLQTAFRWIAMEGAPSSYFGDIAASQIATYKADLAYYVLTLAIAAFVLLRSEWLARQVRKFGEPGKR